ncbi:MAG: U32 family peptidase [Limnochordia bacterium]|nr:U32 family peptidase [Limnochordia bacterium]HOK31174.1 U32 family peptidase [Limnochordia bacterium]HOM00028.1 U32 family peptidase [Limnochordia bacterium]HOQ73086.1 U32 family peptidase [Limnochordia bacterium]HPP71624.1 U32 family peptidase [Limnochordia bacterium]
MKLPELLAPAGNMEKAVVAMEYGADAIYLAGKGFGMRAKAGNFSPEELKEVLALARERGVKVYVTVNTYPRNEEMDQLPAYLEELAELQVDALIIADVGVLALARQYAPGLPLHLSTQANTVNYQAAKFWAELGVTRLVLARELSREEIARIRRETGCELEVFVHGAMCVAYSGRCLLSNVLTGRDANRGECAQSCRWRYAIVEEKRPGEYMPIEEDEGGTHIFNSKDLRLIEYIPDLVQLGVDSLKIEGRMKSAYYVATVVRAYRQALDLYAQNPENYQLPPELLEELDKVSHRPYWAGFFAPTDAGIYRPSSAYIQTHEVVGVVESYDEERKEALVGVRNRLPLGAEVEILQPRGPLVTTVVSRLVQVEPEEELQAAHANFKVRIPMERVKPYSMLRMKKE